MSLVSLPSWGLSMDDLVKREGIYYKKFTDVPFTGKVTGEWQGSMHDGQWNGSWVRYLDNGQLWEKGTYRNGKKHGVWIGYCKNGSLRFKGGYLDGNRDGFHTTNYCPTGQLNSESNYKNGKEHGLFVTWWENGQLMLRGNYKNGKKEGVWQDYDEDGTVGTVFTGTFKNGVKVSD